MGLTSATRARERGIAIFLVITCIAVLALLINEFVYVAQINKRMAWTALDQIQAHYTAKSALKLSLLRLKASQNVRSFLGGAGGDAAQAVQAAIPRRMLDQIWSFPLVFPIPSNAPGLSVGQRAELERFSRETELAGNFSALIESESSRYPINSLLKPFGLGARAAQAPGSTTTSTAGTTAAAPGTGASSSTTTTGTFVPEKGRQGLQDFIAQSIQTRAQTDEAFGSQFRDYRLDDLIDALAGWADWSYARRNRGPENGIRDKGAPFYSLQELHMIDGIDDDLYEFLAPQLTTQWTPGINVNTIDAAAFRRFIPGATEEEAKQYVEFRDSAEQDNFFRNPDAFWKHMTQNVGAFRNDSAEVDRFRKEQEQRGLRVVTDETSFKITINATVNQSTRVIEAWVMQYAVGAQGGAGAAAGAGANQAAAQPSANALNPSLARPDPGLRITFMRLL